MEEITADISWIAVIVGMVASMALGFVWFDPKRGPGKVWAEGVGVGLEPPEKFPAFEMAMNTLGLFLMSWFVGVTAKNEALLTVLLATVAFGVLQAAGAMFAQVSRGAALVSFGYWIISLILMIIAQAIF